MREGGSSPNAFFDKGEPGFERMSKNIKASKQPGDVFLMFGGYRGSADTTLKRLKKIIKNVRKEAGNPKMLFVLVQVGAYKDRKKLLGELLILREQQRQLVIEDDNAILLTSLGQELADFAHLSKKGYFNLANELSQAILKVRYKHKNINWPGPVLDKAILSGNKKYVYAHFAEVKKLSGCVASDFGIIDSKGHARCLSAKASKTLVKLTFDRKIKRPAKLIYGYGWAPEGTLVDEAGNHAPAVQLDLTAGKRPQDKPTKAPRGAGPQNK